MNGNREPDREKAAAVRGGDHLDGNPGGASGGAVSGAGAPTRADENPGGDSVQPPVKKSKFIPVDLIINSKDTLDRGLRLISELWSDQKYLRITIRIGPARKLNQNALYQVWCYEFSAFIYGKPVKEVTEIEQEAMRLSLQRHCYADTAWEFLINRVWDPIEERNMVTRAYTRQFGRGEFYQYMEWVQAFAADRGLILEAKGEYARMKQEAMG